MVFRPDVYMQDGLSRPIGLYAGGASDEIMERLGASDAALATANALTDKLQKVWKAAVATDSSQHDSYHSEVHSIHGIVKSTPFMA